MENGKPKTVNGILLVDKPSGWTSHDVVAKVRGLIKQESGQKLKIGHTGTLDPAATGLLILVLGSYTKRAAEFSKLDKTYGAEITLGAVSSTGDSEGEIKAGYRIEDGGKREKPTREEVEVVLSQFKGKVQQTPHRYSAIKVDGKRAYKEARAGREVKLEPREIEVYSLEITDYDYPKLGINTRVSRGTYIRSLAEDIGEILGTGAYLSALRRTSVGEYFVKDAKTIDKISISDIIKG